MPYRRPGREVTEAWPTLRQAAQLIGISPSTLSRRHDVGSQTAGRYRRLSPISVLSLASHYRKSVLNEVAAALIDLAGDQAPEHVDAIERDVEAYFSKTPVQASLTPGDFADLADLYLPAALAAHVRNVITAAGREKPDSVDTHRPSRVPAMRAAQKPTSTKSVADRRRIRAGRESDRVGLRA